MQNMVTPDQNIMNMNNNMSNLQQGIYGMNNMGLNQLGGLGLLNGGLNTSH